LAFVVLLKVKKFSETEGTKIPKKKKKKNPSFQTPILSKHIQSTVLMNVIELSTIQHSNTTTFIFKSIPLPSFEANNRMLSISDPRKLGYVCFLSIFVRLSELSTPNEVTSKHYETQKFVSQ